MVQGLLERLDNLTRYDIYTAAGELLEITRRNEGVEWAMFTMRDPLIRPHCSHFRTVNHPHRNQLRYTFLQQLPLYVIMSNSILATYAPRPSGSLQRHPVDFRCLEISDV